MAKTNSEMVEDCKARKRAAGLRELRLWVPDKPECIEQLRRLARLLVGGKKQD